MSTVVHVALPSLHPLLTGAREVTFEPLMDPAASSITEEKLSADGCQVSVKGHGAGLTLMNFKYKELVRCEYAYVTEYNSLPGEHVLLTDRYTELLIIQRHKERSEREKEFRSRGQTSHSARDSEQYSNITVEKFLSPDDHGLIPKGVILQGNSGIGKSFTALKIMLDWASDKLYAENFDFIFHLKCKEINQISGEKSLVELLRYSQSLTPAQISQILQHSPERVLFLIDGFDELQLSQDNISALSLPTDVQTPASPESTLKALLSGHLLPECFLLVTTRSTATDTLGKLLKKPQRFTEIMGFSERGVEEYFQRFFKDDQLLQTQAYELVKANETLFTACFIPVICWIICTVFRERYKDGKNTVHDLDTATSIYVDFVSTLLDHHCQGLSQSVLSLLRSLGQLAERGMLEQQVLFDQKSVSETVSDPISNPFLCKFLFRRKIRQETMFSFMHLSFQEFFTALYYVLMSEEESQMKVRDLLQPFKTSGYQNYISTEKLPLLPVIQFICGLSNKDVSSSLIESQSLSVSVTIQDQIKEWILNFLVRGVLSQGSHMRTFIFHCLYELHDDDFVRKAVESWENIDFICTPLKRTDCWVLGYCLQFCPHIRKLSLRGCSITPETLKILQPAVCRSEELELEVENLSDDDVGVLISALGEEKDLTSLRLQKSVLSDQGVQQILNSLNKQKSVHELHLIVKTITTNTAVMIIEFFQSKPNMRCISVEVNEDSDFRPNLSLSVSEIRDRDLRVHIDHVRRTTSSEIDESSVISRPRTKAPLSVTSFTCPHSEISNINWTTFTQIIYGENVSREKYTDLDEQFDALLSFLSSVPGLESVHLYVNRLTESWAAMILSLIQTCPSLCDIFVTVKGQNDESLCSLLRMFVTDGDFRLLLEDDRWKFRSSEISRPQTEPSLSEISLTCPHSGTSNVNWTTFIQIIYGVKISRERYTDLDEQFDALLSFLSSVPGLESVHLNVNSLTESCAVRILFLIKTCPSLCDILWTCTKTSDQCTRNEDCNLKVKLQLCGESFDSTESDEQLDGLLSFLSSVSGLKELVLNVNSLTQSWAARILSLIQTCPSLQDIRYTDLDEQFDALLCFLSSVSGLERVHLNVNSLTESCAVRILFLIQTCPSLQDIRLEVGSNSDEGLCSLLIVSVTNGDFRSPELGLRDQLDSLLSFLNFVPGLKRVDLDVDSLTESWATRILSLIQTCPSLQDIRWTCTETSYQCTKLGHHSDGCNLRVNLQLCGENFNSTEFDEQFHDLLSFLCSVPGLKDVHMTVWRLTESYAARILSLIQTCPSLQDISFKAGDVGKGLLLEEGIRLLQHSQIRPDCTLTVEGCVKTQETQNVGVAEQRIGWKQVEMH
ncbi:uncharacterized protein LOC115811245 [Chanos chanos]|uniref:Uncharacterized protein LOC115811245 n=1 Tax=Chanos chanos TaxID=29144 RepID=A0A6J2VAB5_CHACN|nr:uncharacterized protein LOC115811245 [Chanos chanos]